MTTDIGGCIESHRTAKDAVAAILASADDKFAVRPGEIERGNGWNSLSFREPGAFGWRGCGTIFASVRTLRKIRRSFVGRGRA
jgi:hypothetical protein